MQYSVTCPSCQHQLTVNPGWEGQQVNCPLCSGSFVMPSPSASFFRVAQETVNAIENRPNALAQIPSLQSPPQGRNELRSWWKVLGVAFACCVLFSNLFQLVFQQGRPDAKTSAVKPLVPAPPMSSASEIFKATGSEALKLAEKHVVGTWIYSGTDYRISVPVGFQTFERFRWIKWVINEDGTALQYMVSPDSDGWGEPTESRWSVGTGKYADTGERFYHLIFNPGDKIAMDIDQLEGRRIVIKSDGTLLYRYYGKDPNDTSHIVIMTKGDLFPFSK